VLKNINYLRAKHNNNLQLFPASGDRKGFHVESARIDAGATTWKRGNQKICQRIAKKSKESKINFKIFYKIFTDFSTPPLKHRGRNSHPD